MKKIINTPEGYTDDMLRGIYASHPDKVTYAAGDLRCYCVANKKPGKVAIITGGGTGHLPLFLGYVGDGLLDGCGVGGVFQSPSAEQIYTISKQVEAGAGILYLYGNYTGDIMNFDMAAEMLEMDDIEVKSIVGADDTLSSSNVSARRGVAGIFFMYKAAGAKADQMGFSLSKSSAPEGSRTPGPQKCELPNPFPAPVTGAFLLRVPGYFSVFARVALLHPFRVQPFEEELSGFCAEYST